MQTQTLEQRIAAYLERVYLGAPPRSTALMTRGGDQKYFTVHPDDRRYILAPAALLEHAAGRCTYAVTLDHAPLIAIDVDQGGSAAIEAFMVAARSLRLPAVAVVMAGHAGQHSGGHVVIFTGHVVDQQGRRAVARLLREKARPALEQLAVDVDAIELWPPPLDGVEPGERANTNPIRLLPGRHQRNQTWGELLTLEGEIISMDTIEGRAQAVDQLQLLEQVALGERQKTIAGVIDLAARWAEQRDQRRAQELEQQAEQAQAERATAAPISRNYHFTKSSDNPIERTNRHNDLVAYLERQGGRVARGKARGEIARMHCPCGQHQHGDRDASLSIVMSARGEQCALGNVPACRFFGTRGKKYNFVNVAIALEGLQLVDVIKKYGPPVDYVSQNSAGARPARQAQPPHPATLPPAELERQAPRRSPAQAAANSRQDEQRKAARHDATAQELANIDRRLDRDDLPDTAIALGLLLATLCQDTGRLQCSPTNDQLQAQLGKSERTIRYSFRALERAGLGERSGGTNTNGPRAATWTWARIGMPRGQEQAERDQDLPPTHVEIHDSLQPLTHVRGGQPAQAQELEQAGEQQQLVDVDQGATLPPASKQAPPPAVDLERLSFASYVRNLGEQLGERYDLEQLYALPPAELAALEGTISAAIAAGEGEQAQELEQQQLVDAAAGAAVAPPAHVAMVDQQQAVDDQQQAIELGGGWYGYTGGAAYNPRGAWAPAAITLDMAPAIVDQGGAQALEGEQLQLVDDLAAAVDAGDRAGQELATMPRLPRRSPSTRASNAPMTLENTLDRRDLYALELARMPIDQLQREVHRRYNVVMKYAHDIWTWRKLLAALGELDQRGERDQLGMARLEYLENLRGVPLSYVEYLEARRARAAAERALKVQKSAKRGKKGPIGTVRAQGDQMALMLA